MPQAAIQQYAEPMGRKVRTEKPAKTVSYKVKVEWLDDGQCFMATSDDIDGLVLQADTLDEMEVEMRDIIPVLLEGNHNVIVDGESLSLDQGRSSSAKVKKYMISHPA